MTKGKMIELLRLCKMMIYGLKFMTQYLVMTMVLNEVTI